MSSLPISFDVQRVDHSKKANVAYQKQIVSFDEALDQEEKLKILERDDYTCACCGFVSKKYQKILFKDRDMRNKDMNNLITTCIFCHQCFHIDTVPQMKSGVLVWLPEISQARLHHIIRSVYVARISQGAMSENARKILELLMERRKEAEARLGTDDPYVLSTVMKDYLEDAHYAHANKKLEGVRLLPLDRRIIKEGDLEFNQFPQILAFWRSKDGPFGGKLPNTWLSEYKSLKLGETQAA